VDDASASASDIMDEYTGEVDVVAAAEDLRAAADCLARITGRGISGDVEEVLGVVFEKFCVGK
jgi:tRNA U34 5-carboxymethylaminomethyl modifying GTPase MnmE/TrmE